MSTPSPPAQNTLRIAALGIAKNEGPWLIEWAAHCKAVGFNVIVLGTNDCDDGTDKIADILQDMGVLTHFDNAPPYYRRNQYQAPSLQLTAYHRMQSMPEVADCDWVMPLDIDEFFVGHVGDGTVQALCAKHHKAHGIMMRWRMFGDNGLTGMITPPITDQLTRCSKKEDHNNENVKMLVRDHQEVDLDMHISVRRRIDPEANAYQRMVRKLKGKRERAYISFDGKLYGLQRAYGNKKYLEYFKDRARDYVDAQVNHYAVRTIDLCRLKSIRGDAYYTHTNRFQKDYIDRFNRNEVEDTSIFKYREKRDALLTEWFSNKDLKDLHQTAIEVTREKLARMDAEGYEVPDVGEKNIRLSSQDLKKWQRDNSRKQG
ncbi:MAG: glycosyltransferase family 2 protein [Pseudomonadota bacterium]